MEEVLWESVDRTRGAWDKETCEESCALSGRVGNVMDT